MKLYIEPQHKTKDNKYNFFSLREQIGNHQNLKIEFLIKHKCLEQIYLGCSPNISCFEEKRKSKIKIRRKSKKWTHRKGSCGRIVLYYDRISLDIHKPRKRFWIPDRLIIYICTFSITNHILKQLNDHTKRGRWDISKAKKGYKKDSQLITPNISSSRK